MYQGEARIRSTPNGVSGTSPPKLATWNSGEYPSSGDVGSGGGMVLVADDEPANREVVRAMLHRVGFDVVTVEDGAAAVARFREAPDAIRLVIVDLTMPHLGGDETFRRIREIRPDVPIVVMSGYGQSEVSRRLGDGSLSAFLRKPFTTSGLLEVVWSVLGDA